MDRSFGETRLTTGSIYTDKLYTGQREMAGLGIYHYQARFYSPKIGRFLSADTIVPGFANPQNLNRMSYVLNNPLKYIDPTGHCSVSGHWVPDSSPACQWASNNQGSLSGNGNGGFSGGGNGGGGGGGGGGDDDDGGPNPIAGEPGLDGSQTSLLPTPNTFWGGSYCGGGPNGLYNYLDCGANYAQDLALLIDIPFAGLEAVLFSAGCFAGPKGCLLGVSLGQAAFNASGANKHEMGLSFTAMTLSIAADFSDDGRFGESSVVAITGAALGSLSKDPMIDAAIDGFGSAYNHEINPIYGIPSWIGSFFSP